MALSPNPFRHSLSCLIFLFCFPGVSSAFDADADWDRLQSQARAKGSVRAMVRLKETKAFDGALSTQEAQTDRARTVHSLQNDVLADLRAGSALAEPTARFDYIPYLALRADAETLAKLRDDPRVLDIREERRYRPNLIDSVPLVGGNLAFDKGFSGSGQAVAILDTGVEKEHLFLSGRVASEACYSTTDPGNLATSVCPGGASSSTAPGSGQPCNADVPALDDAGCNHGTHVAGIAAGKGSGSNVAFNGVARNADIIAVQVFSRIDNVTTCDGASFTPCIIGFDSDLLQAMERVLTLSATLPVAAVNLSLGGGSFTSACDSSEAAFKSIVDLLKQAGVATVAASGNESTANALGAPACISSVVSVGATNKSDAVVSFSNSASFLDLLAPGNQIRSSVPDDGTGSFVQTTQASNSFANLSGTSQAAPHVAGAFAVLRGFLASQAGVDIKSAATVNNILDALKDTGKSIVDARNGLAFSRIQVDKAFDNLDIHISFTGAPSAVPDLAAPAQTVQLSATATDELGHALGYSWTASCPALGTGGSFDSATAQNPKWTAPANATVFKVDCKLEVTANDGQGQQVSKSTDVGVRGTYSLERDKGKRVLSPYWQSGPGIYTFVAVSHPSLSGMNSQIGVEMLAVADEGAGLFSLPLRFTIDSNATKNIFIAGTNHSFLNPDSIPTALFMIGTAGDKSGFLSIQPVASAPEKFLGVAGSRSRGFPDTNALVYWGAVVVQNSSTGFAMEFIGDLHDSTAFSPGQGASFSGIN